jgi:hypothetical protein
MSVHDENDATVFTCKNCGERYTDHFDEAIINAHRKGYCCKILNIKNFKGNVPDNCLYIGRYNKYYYQCESIFHNPFVTGEDGTRAEVIQKFKEHAESDKTIQRELKLLDKYKYLTCSCDFPHEDCHGRILLELREKQKALELQTKDKIKLAIVGSRSIKNKKVVFDYLDKRKDKIKMIISGGAAGPDSFAHEWCVDFGMPILIYYPDWHGLGKSAGFVRNQNIIEEADFVTAFWDGKSKGTAHDIELCKQMDKKHRIVLVND